MDIVKNILTVAKEHGYNNKQLCELLNKNPSYITDWKNGKSRPKADELLILSKTFGVSIDYLLGQPDTPTPEQIDSFSEESVDLTPEERDKTIEYMKFLKSQREK